APRPPSPVLNSLVITVDIPLSVQPCSLSSCSLCNPMHHSRSVFPLIVFSFPDFVRQVIGRDLGGNGRELVVYHNFNQPPIRSLFPLPSPWLFFLFPVNSLPVQVMAENWVVYHYFNLAASRHEVSTIELLDTSLKDVPVIDYLKYGLSIPGSSNLTAPLSAAEIPWERVKRLRQSYYFPYALRCISVTSTLAGITNKHVLFGTALDQVLALDRRFLDPRRVPEPSQQDKEAGIMPYSDSLPAPGQAYLTHRYRIEGLKNILSFPTRLESTTLVLAHGLDLFFVRTAPSRVFDSLGEDFSFALLLGTIAVLSIAILVTWGLSRKQELKQRWK
ncbi:unnamed protein product, partial [Closterium sp. NIES-54]